MINKRCLQPRTNGSVMRTAITTAHSTLYFCITNYLCMFLSEIKLYFKTRPSSLTPVTLPNKVFGVRMNPELAKKLKILAVKKDTQIYKLLEEAIVDLLKKYKEL
jgi:hypothetical protein